MRRDPAATWEWERLMRLKAARAALESLTCPVCFMTSYNPGDVREGYCGHCHAWTSARITP